MLMECGRPLPRTSRGPRIPGVAATAPTGPRTGLRARRAARRVVVAALALAAVLAAPARAPEGEAALVTTDAVKAEPLSQTVPIIGRVVARQAGVVAARARGPVAEVRVQVGDRVETGDVLAVLVTDSLEQERQRRAAVVEQERARRARARAELDLARQDARRAAKLKGSAAFSGARFEDARARAAAAAGALAEAEAQLRVAEAELRLAEIALDYATVRAPFPGVVTRRHTVEGAYLNVGDPVVGLLNDKDLEIEADVPAKRIPGLAPGAGIDFALEDGTRYRATVRAIVPDENAMTRTRAVRFTPLFGDAPPPLAANQSVTVYLPIGEPREAVTVHKDAVIHRQGQAMVFVVEDGIARPRPIRLGEAVGGRFEVLDGLAPGDVVVIRGNERLMPGQKVVSGPES